MEDNITNGVPLSYSTAQPQCRTIAQAHNIDKSKPDPSANRRSVKFIHNLGYTVVIFALAAYTATGFGGDSLGARFTAEFFGQRIFSAHQQRTAAVLLGLVGAANLLVTKSSEKFYSFVIIADFLIFLHYIVECFIFKEFPVVVLLMVPAFAIIPAVFAFFGIEMSIQLPLLCKKTRKDLEHYAHME